MRFTKQLGVLAGIFLVALVGMVVGYPFGRSRMNDMVPVGFAFATVIPLAVGPLTVAAGRVGSRHDQMGGVSLPGLLLVGASIPLVSGSYAVEVMFAISPAAFEVPVYLRFNHEWSVLARTALFGDLLWALGALVSMWHLCGRDDGWRVMGWSFRVAAVLSIAACVGYMMGIGAMVHLKTVSLAALLPAVLVAFRAGPGWLDSKAGGYDGSAGFN